MACKRVGRKLLAQLKPDSGRKTRLRTKILGTLTRVVPLLEHQKRQIPEQGQ